MKTEQNPGCRSIERMFRRFLARPYTRAGSATQKSAGQRMVVLQACRLAVLSLALWMPPACQHAILELPEARTPFGRPPQPATDDYQTMRKGDEVRIEQNYYLFGLLPRRMEYDEMKLCPAHGIKRIHQYSSWADELLTQVTLGIYAPRTLQIQCHERAKEHSP